MRVVWCKLKLVLVWVLGVCLFWAFLFVLGLLWWLWVVYLVVMFDLVFMISVFDLNCFRLCFCGQECGSGECLVTCGTLWVGCVMCACCFECFGFVGAEDCAFWVCVVCVAYCVAVDLLWLIGLLL